MCPNSACLIEWSTLLGLVVGTYPDVPILVSIGGNCQMGLVGVQQDDLQLQIM